MKLSESSFLADENIQPEVITHLLERKIDIVTVFDAGLAGKPDWTIFYPKKLREPTVS
jgi:hypothetical protein